MEVERRVNLGRRRSDHGVVRWARRAAVAYMVLFGVATVYSVVTAERVRDNSRLIQANAYASCHRANVLLAATNASSAADYAYFAQVAEALSRAPLRGFGDGFIRRLVSISHAKTWAPLNNCQGRALAPGTALPIPFYEMPVPRSAMKVGSGQ